MITDTPRATGVTLRLLDFTSVLDDVAKQTGATFDVGFGPYAAIEHDGVLYAICTEGVGWEVSDGKPLELDLYLKTPPGTISIFPSLLARLSADEVRALMTDDEVDLADHIRSFGARLEDNFWRLHRVLTQRTTETQEV